MFINHIDPVLFRIGNMQIRYYGLFFVIGLLAFVSFLMYLSHKKKIDMAKFEVLEFTLWGSIGLLVFTRLFYAIVYNFSYFYSNPMKIFALNQGGISFHGGFIGAIIGGYLYCMAYKKDFWQLADLTAFMSTIGIFLVRIANFTNSELVGRITNVPWAVNFNNEADKAGNLIYRHPSQLYESAKNIVIFFTLLFLYTKKKLKKGGLFAVFILMYGTLRFFIEFFREPDPQIGFILGFTMGQIINVFMIALGAYLLFRTQRRPEEIKQKQYSLRS